MNIPGTITSADTIRVGWAVQVGQASCLSQQTDSRTAERLLGGECQRFFNYIFSDGGDSQDACPTVLLRHVS